MSDRRASFILLGLSIISLCLGGGQNSEAFAANGKIVYVTDGLDLPFWRYVAVGVSDVAKTSGFSYAALDSHHDAQTQMQNTQDALAKDTTGIVLSPTDSSSAPNVLTLAAKSNVPVAFAGIGTISGTYASLVTSEDDRGAYGVGAELAKTLAAHNWRRAEVGIVQISQARVNGKKRTAGFEKAMTETGNTIVARNEMRTYTVDETYHFVQDMLTAHPDMHAVFIETDQPALGALRAISAMHRTNDVLVAAFDGIPDFIPMLKNGTIVVSGMQQPYLMGKYAAEQVVNSIQKKPVEREIVLPILVVTKDNIDSLLPTIKQTVFANEVK
jgi:ribose transport system substrate-binding protein